jgi:hypothetical protein
LFEQQKQKLCCCFNCDQNKDKFGHTFSCYLFNKPASEAGLLNESSSLASALGVTKFITAIATNLVALGWLVQQKHELSSYFNCDQNKDEFGHTFLYNSSLT